MSDIHEPFVQLLTEAQPRLIVYVRSLVREPNLAKDILQDVNLVLWRKMDEFELGTDFWAWACRVAYFEVKAHRTRQARSRLVFNDSLMSQLAVTAQNRLELDRERHEALQTCFKKLPEKQQSLLQRRYFNSLPVKTMAQQMGKSADAIGKSIQRARQSLLACIEQTLVMEDHG